jgi:hypothetical protein
MVQFIGIVRQKKIADPVCIETFMRGSTFNHKVVQAKPFFKDPKGVICHHAVLTSEPNPIVHPDVCKGGGEHFCAAFGRSRGVEIGGKNHSNSPGTLRNLATAC